MGVGEGCHHCLEWEWKFVVHVANPEGEFRAMSACKANYMPADNHGLPSAGCCSGKGPILSNVLNYALSRLDHLRASWMHLNVSFAWHSPLSCFIVSTSIRNLHVLTSAVLGFVRELSAVMVVASGENLVIGKKLEICPKDRDVVLTRFNSSWLDSFSLISLPSQTTSSGWCILWCIL
jgi:hypothetical protein